MVEFGWDTESDWENAQASDDIVVDGSSFSLENAVTVVDDFEDGNLSEYAGDTFYASVQSNTVFEGSNALKFNADGSSRLIYSTSGLNAYPSAGDTFTLRAWLPTANTGMKTYFGVQDSNNYYATFMQDFEQQWQLFKYENGTETSLVDKTNQGIPQDQWARQEIDWQSDGTIECRLYDSSGTLVSTISATDSTFSSGGIGFGTYGNYDHYWDNMVIL